MKHHVPGTFVPVGAVLPYAGSLAASDGHAASIAEIRSNLATAGWFFCDGAPLPVSGYPALFGTIGYAFGGGGDSFCLPDLRGQFIRGVSESLDQDPDREERSRPAASTKPALKAWMVGSSQLDALQVHEHNYLTPTASAPAGGEGELPLIKPDTSATTTGCVAASGGAAPRTSTETRPRNVYLNYIIRFRAEGPDPTRWARG